MVQVKAMIKFSQLAAPSIDMVLTKILRPILTKRSILPVFIRTFVVCLEVERLMKILGKKKLPNTSMTKHATAPRANRASLESSPDLPGQIPMDSSLV